MLLNELFFLNSNRYFERTYSSVLKMSSSVIVICCRSTGIFLLHCKCVTMFGRPRLLICKIFCCWKAISIDLHQMFWLPDRMWKSEIFNRFQIVSFNYELMNFFGCPAYYGIFCPDRRCWWIPDSIEWVGFRLCRHVWTKMERNYSYRFDRVYLLVSTYKENFFY